MSYVTFVLDKYILKHKHTLDKTL